MSEADTVKTVSSREFQGNYHRYTEPVEVYRYREFMGRWYPIGSQAPEPKEPPRKKKS